MKACDTRSSTYSDTTPPLAWMQAPLTPPSLGKFRMNDEALLQLLGREANQSFVGSQVEPAPAPAPGSFWQKRGNGVCFWQFGCRRSFCRALAVLLSWHLHHILETVLEEAINLTTSWTEVPCWRSWCDLTGLQAPTHATSSTNQSVRRKRKHLSVAITGASPLHLWSVSFASWFKITFAS